MAMDFLKFKRLRFETILLNSCASAIKILILLYINELEK